MYEIWLAANILFELARTVWPLLLAGALIWTVLMMLALNRRGPLLGPSLYKALFSGLGVLVVAMLAVPALTQSSLSELRYWVDWANLFALAAGFGAAAAALAWPLWAIRDASRMA